MFPTYNEGYAKNAVANFLGEKDSYIAQFIEGITNKSYFQENEERDLNKKIQESTFVLQELRDQEKFISPDNSEEM